MDQNNVINIDFGSVDYSPAIIDYDFKNNKPRGGSCRIDFFSQGIVSTSLDDIKDKQKIYLKKSGTFFSRGMFILDFKECLDKPELLIDMLKDLNVGKVYIEKSKEFDLSSILEKVSNIEIVYLTFSSQE